MVVEQVSNCNHNRLIKSGIPVVTYVNNIAHTNEISFFQNFYIDF